jgi:hypothetical protein
LLSELSATNRSRSIGIAVGPLSAVSRFHRSRINDQPLVIIGTLGRAAAVGSTTSAR